MKSLYRLLVLIGGILIAFSVKGKIDGKTEPAPFSVNAGVDRVVVEGGKTYLAAEVTGEVENPVYYWSQVSGPANVVFEDPFATSTTAFFSKKGNYEISILVSANKSRSTSNLKIQVKEQPPPDNLDIVYTKKYSINSPFWDNRIKSVITNWIPWCIDQLNSTDLKEGYGGIDNFIQAGKALSGELHRNHLGYVYSDAWVYQTVESMCLALSIDPEGDTDVIKAQDKMRSTLREWIPLILDAQEPDGYIHTAWTLRDSSRWKTRWEPRNRSNHEGFVAGLFIEAAISHYILTDGQDKRLYNAALKLADCWVSNIGPTKSKDWYDGHQGMEMALVKLGRFAGENEGGSKGNDYISLAKYLLECRGDGREYDQSNIPVAQQYEAVGHSVRAMNNVSGIADIAMETHLPDYQSAALSIWNSIVNRKYYITGGVGSIQEYEGFGADYSLDNNSVCESCSSCGLIVFQHKMNALSHEARYADLYEETIYNALLGSLDLDAKNFYRTNSLTSSGSRQEWHTNPCCIGNIPRTLLKIPTWTYSRSDEGLYVNMFIGSRITIEDMAGNDVEIVQNTNYPWDGHVELILNPASANEFTLFVRMPDRKTSALYYTEPYLAGIKALYVNNEKTDIVSENGYLKIHRQWEPGDRVTFELPLAVQMITADNRVEDNNNKVALKYGPLVYNVEKVDNPDLGKYIDLKAFETEWEEDLLDGVMTIRGSWEDGSQLLAIPYYARNNRNNMDPGEQGPDEKSDEGSIVWINRR